MQSLLSALHPRARWLISLAALGVFFAADDQTSVVAVLPAMIDDIGLPADRFYRAAWIINGYILGYVVAMPLMGRIADRFGHGRVFAVAMAIFMVGSAAVALSGGLFALSLSRGLQAAGGGAVVPVAMAIVVSSLPSGNRALGLGFIAAVSEAGGLLGPLWGGGIAELIGWRGIFWINLPLCLPIAIGAWRLSGGVTRNVSDFDLTGAILAGLCLACLTLALTDDPIEPRPAAVTAGLLLAAMVLLAGFAFWERRVPAPLFDLKLLRRLPVSASLAANGLSGGTLIVAMVSLPLYTNVVLDGSALDGGLNLMRLTLGLPIGAVAGGWLASRWSNAGPASLGMACSGAGYLVITGWPAPPGFWEMTLPLFGIGIGFGLVLAPFSASLLGQVAETERATYAALLTVMRLAGALVGVSLLTSQGLGGFYSQAGLLPLDAPDFVPRLADLQAETFSRIFRYTAVVCFLTILPSLLLARPEREGDEFPQMSQEG